MPVGGAARAIVECNGAGRAPSLATNLSVCDIALWTERVNRFMERKVEPPTHYVQHASKAKKSTKLSATGKKKTKGAAIKNEKMTKLEAR